MNDIQNLESLKKLVNNFEQNIIQNKTPSYNEAQLRMDFLDPFFNTLGWDVRNQSGQNTQQREVIIEENIKVTNSEYNKKPDYTFRINSTRKFFAEAKKPTVNIEKDAKSAKQVRRYGFSAKLPISILTNFEYLAIYDCSTPVSDDDGFIHSRIALYHYSEYVDKFDEILIKIGRQSVFEGSFDSHWEDISKRIEKAPVDDIFLNMINNWRLNFAEYFIKINPSLTMDELNDLIQSYVNSIIFLRMCEDRQLEDVDTLYRLYERKDYQSLIDMIKKSDKKYNAGLFNLKYIDDFFNVNNTYIWEVIKQLYYPENPFSFLILPVEIIGQIYERFLGFKVGFNQNNKAEFIAVNVDRDVVSTPTRIVKAIVNEIIEQHLRGKDPLTALLESTYADIACGSGAFLIEVYQHLHDKLVDIYQLKDTTKIELIGANRYKLKYEVKKQLLLNCIFGVDKDFNAVRATQFSLLIKLLEDENTIPSQLPLLPSLSNNICFGNTLIDSNDLVGQDIATITEINPYDFGDQRFDVIVGNPPYLATEHIKQNTHPTEFSIYGSKFTVSTKQFDKYYLFIEQAYRLLKDEGWLGYIIPHKFFKVNAAQALRKFLIRNKFLYEIVYFNTHQIFKGKSTYTALFYAQKNPKPVNSQAIYFYDVEDYDSWQLNKNNNTCYIYNFNMLESMTRHYSVWALKYKDNFKDNLHRFIKLGDLLDKGTISNGIQTSANGEYIHQVDKEDNDYLYFTYKKKQYQVEKAVTRPYFQTPKSHIEKLSRGLNTYNSLEPNSFVIYPYEKIEGKIKLIEIDRIKKDFPYLFNYLTDVRMILCKPERSIEPKPTTNNEWYRYGRHQALESCDVPEKIIVGILSKGGKYAIDKNHTFISSGSTAGYCFITLPENFPYSVYYIQAILNSKYSEYYFSSFGEEFSGGYIARGTKRLSEVLIPKINFGDMASKKIHDDIAELQKQLIDINDNIVENSSNERIVTPLKRQFALLESQLKDKLKSAYDFTKEEEESFPEIEDLYR